MFILFFFLMTDAQTRFVVACLVFSYFFSLLLSDDDRGVDWRRGIIYSY
jgi:hypothetical protein